MPRASINPSAQTSLRVVGHMVRGGYEDCASSPASASQSHDQSPREIAERGCQALATLVATYPVCREILLATHACGSALELVIQSGQLDFSRHEEAQQLEHYGMRKLCEAYGHLWKTCESELVMNAPWPEESVAQSLYAVRESLLRTIDEATRFLKGFSPHSLGDAIEALEYSSNVAVAALNLPSAPRLNATSFVGLPEDDGLF